MSAVGIDQMREAAEKALARGNHEGAVLLFTRAVEASGSKEDMRYLAGRCAAYLKLEKHEEALEDAEQAVKLRPKWAKGHALRGLALLSLRCYEGAQVALRQALELDKSNSEALKGLQRLKMVSLAERKRGNSGPPLGRAKPTIDSGLAAESRDDPCSKEPESPEDKHNSTSVIQDDPLAKPNPSPGEVTSQPGTLSEVLSEALKAITACPRSPQGYLRAVVALQGSQEWEKAYEICIRGLHNCMGDSQLGGALKGCLEGVAKWESPPATARDAKYGKMDAHLPNQKVRVFAVSDIHVDHPGNLEWCQGLSNTEYLQDTLLLAGDVADTFLGIKAALEILKRKFRRVVFSPGNHDLWIRPDLRSMDEEAVFPDSVSKMLALIDLCDSLGVETAPAEVAEGLRIMPLYSWYNDDFDERDRNPGHMRMDRFCKWPVSEDKVWELMLLLNEIHVQRIFSGTTLSFSHFLPRRGLPFPSMPGFAKCVGCPQLDLQVQSLKSAVHVFGHTHINYDTVRGGTRCVQYALGLHRAKLMCIWDNGRPQADLHHTY